MWATSEFQLGEREFGDPSGFPKFFDSAFFMFVLSFYCVWFECVRTGLTRN